MIIFSLAPIMGKKVYTGLEPSTFSLQEYGGSLFALSSKRLLWTVPLCVLYFLFRSGQLKGSMALCKHTLHQGSNPKPVKFVSTASNLCHYTKEHMCLMIQSKTSEKPQKVSLLFRVKEILFLSV